MNFDGRQMQPYGAPQGQSYGANLGLIGSTPPNAPPNGRDILLILRPPPPGSDPRTPMTPFMISLELLATTLAQIQSGGVLTAASGLNQASATLLRPGVVAIVNAGGPTNGLLLPVGAGSQTILNILQGTVLLYPPMIAGVATQINGSGNGVPVPIPAGSEITFRSSDLNGYSWVSAG